MYVSLLFSCPARWRELAKKTEVKRERERESGKGRQKEGGDGNKRREKEIKSERKEIQR